MSPELVVGVDFGTGSARAVVVDTRSGASSGPVKRSTPDGPRENTAIPTEPSSGSIPRIT